MCAGSYPPPAGAPTMGAVRRRNHRPERAAVLLVEGPGRTHMKYSELVWTAVIAAFTVSMGAAPAAAKGGSSNAKVKPTVGVPAAKPATTTKARSSTVTAVPKTKAPAPRVKATSATKAKTSASPKVSSKPAAAKGATRPTATSAKRTEPKPSLATGPTAETKPTATGPTAPTVPL